MSCDAQVGEGRRTHDANDLVLHGSAFIAVVTFFMLATRMNNHAAVLPFCRPCNELTTSRRKEVVVPLFIHVIF